MSAAASIIGQCEECCVCPEATVEWDSRSTSLTKCGFCSLNEGGGCFSNKRYFTLTISGYAERFGVGATCDDIISSIDKFVYSGSCTSSLSGTADANGCGFYTTNTQQREIYIGGVLFSTEALNCGVLVSSGTSGIPVSLRTETQLYYDGEFCALPGSTRLTVSTVHNDFSDEYTTATLKTNTVAALPAYDNDWNDTAGSFANLSTDELTYSIRESRYRLRFKIPLIGFGDCYKVTWIERFTPEGGGAPTDTARCDIWDGTIPPGYDPDNSATWPVLPSASPFYYELPVPSTDGTTTVVSVVAECRDCSACP